MNVILRTSLFAAALARALCAQNPDTVQLHTLPVQGNVYMITGAGLNIAAQIGKDGVLLVDTMPPARVPNIVAELRKLTDQPIRYVVDTSLTPDHVSGNDALIPFGATGATQVAGGGPTIIAHENVLNRMTTPVKSAQTPPPQRGLPNDEYFTPTKDLYFNGEPVVVIHEPAAHTDGDSIVLFRRSDVIAAGDIFTPDRYPEIDLAHGGSVKGLLDALNHLLHLTVPERLQDGGTRVIPGHGRLCNEADVVEYRDMVTIVRDRIQASLKKGMTLQQVKASKPTLDYDNQYGPGDAFIETVYKSLGDK
ncbi:MAG TPA: MBL fold metallo-hydrolase [Bryobacteraceae bacterium]|nr:MBL fold metallo-hydrolase [Bryobacteraceae bacterium]